MSYKEIFKNFIQRLTSRKFLLALIGSVVTFGNAYWDWGLTTEQVLTVLAPLLAFISAEGISDFMRAKNTINNQ